ncbi:tRNA lysidine(34) synthetase TilS [Marinobacter sp.]|uniref:tRNA lysidine(34) synthetase TilS n=1 Tax=Marinobacter sp. TaxID=50741 RepID=UPI00384BD91A
MTQGGSQGATSHTWPAELVEALGSLPPASRVWVAFSGGLDSTLLLHLVNDCLPATGGSGLRAIHINHQLQPNAEACEAHCRRTCDHLSVPLLVEAVTVKPGKAGSSAGSGLEEAARKARYEVFERVLDVGDLLLMAHHADDQIETVLFRLVRGSAAAGLAGMPRTRPLGSAELARPLLAFSRARLCAWALDANLSWIEDPSNTDLRFDRNFLRRSVIPLLRQRWPNLLKRMERTAHSCGEQALLADRLAEIQSDLCEDDEGRLRLPCLAELGAPEQKNLLRWWISKKGFDLPPMRYLDRALVELIHAADDRSPELRGPGYSLRRYQKSLYLVQQQEELPEGPLPLNVGEPVCWGRYVISLEPATDAPGPPPFLVVTARQGGERIREHPARTSRSLKKWLQEKAVVPWERDRLPLVWKGSELVAVPGLWLSPAFSGPSPESGWRIVQERDFD